MGSDSYQRATWNRKTEFILSMLGYCVGLGNVWRFPFLAYETGGGAFLVPYLIMLVFAGIPMMLLEMALGQYSSQGIITVWNSLPLLRGIGFGIIIALSLSKMSSTLVTAYSFYYLFASFQKTLPWVGCHQDWNTVYCSELFEECLGSAGIIVNNGSCVPLDILTESQLEEYNVKRISTNNFDLANYTDPYYGQRVRPSEEYWSIRVRKESSSMQETGGIVWEVALCLLLSWFTIFCCLVKGIKTSGKVVYITATLPYIFLTILLVLGLTLDGHGDGIYFFIYPRWEILKTPRAWLNGAVQIFFSLGPAWGGIITLSSYNKFRNNLYIDSICISIANSATSIFAGFVIFSFLGYLAHELGRDVSTVVSQGYGLAFIVYPEAVALLPVSPLWSILFFLMLIMLALDSHFASIESNVTAVVDLLPVRWKKYKIHILLGYCIVSFLVGLICTTRAGPYWANLIDQTAIGIASLLFALLEALGISWIYGFKRLKNDIRSMIGDKWVDHWTFVIWPFMWCFVTPAILLTVLIFNFTSWTYPTYNGPYPSWALMISWFINFACFISIPLVIIYNITAASGSIMQRLRAMISPQDSWGPLLQDNREHAWRCHENHGTSMGGKLLPGSGSDTNEMSEISTKA
ncbi:Sodium- and chloride-dependent glycine transporter 2 [Holothuria leucospilota]|uniref:Sodium- and chloride-dependent glycine transporter 2 n=1 Tax=Holothuria leucospilota TaxID=206669 RepID=A0A9Q1BDE6_HOLLE|nr:Sodium- and chloride-dependent glycine transporter 2 [Holothuria leucospilota]